MVRLKPLPLVEVGGLLEVQKFETSLGNEKEPRNLATPTKLARCGDAPVVPATQRLRWDDHLSPGSSWLQ